MNARALIASVTAIVAVTFSLSAAPAREIRRMPVATHAPKVIVAEKEPHKTADGTAYTIFNPVLYASARGPMPMSPDGRYAPIAIAVARSVRSFGVIDLATGDYTELSSAPESSLWWSPDSRSVLYTRDRRLVTYDFDTLTTTDVLPDVEAVWAFAVRD